MAPVFGDSPPPLARWIDDASLAEIGAILARGRDFSISDYKSNCMKRRVAIRIHATRCRDTAEYCTLLRHSEEELDLLQRALTIHISQFFRNPSLFQMLRLQVLPDLFAIAATRPDRSLTICCLGCACGEEPYSLAIMLREHFPRELAQTTTVINGIDIDGETLETARQGEYDGDCLGEMPAEIRRRYFRKQGERFRLTDDILGMVRFTRGNITDIRNTPPLRHAALPQHADLLHPAGAGANPGRYRRDSPPGGHTGAGKIGNHAWSCAPPFCRHLSGGADLSQNRLKPVTRDW